MSSPILRKPHSIGPLLTFLALGGISLLVAWLSRLFESGVETVPIGELLRASIEDGAMGAYPEVIIAVLGVSITVVAIIVELASNRYTPRITELFMSSTINISILGFFVVTGMMCIWSSVTTGHEEVIPYVTATVTLIFVSICMLLLLPYFAFVFHFVNPHTIVDRMGNSVFSAIRKGGAGRQAGRMKKMAEQGIEQLADVASGAIESRDKVVCMHAVSALGQLSIVYLDIKKSLNPGWFQMEEHIRENPDFVSMQAEILTDIEDNRCWIEMKILRQFQMLYGTSLNRMRDINYLLAIHTRKIGEKAMTCGDETIVALCVKFFNTFLRATINAKDVRTAYNVLNQYRLFAQSALEAGRNEIAVEITKRFKYYGQLGFSSGIAFILETAAYDLCELNEMALRIQAGCRQQLLDIFLEVDKEAEEDHSMEASLRGVRKAQIKLATFYLTQNEEGLARLIFEDMKNELPSRLSSIHQELRGIQSREFWEVNDRGINFDYLHADRRPALETFFGWFEEAR